MRWLLLTMLLFAGCPAPEDAPCSRLVVDAEGIPLETGHPTPPTPLVVVGLPLELTFAAPVTSCVSDALRVEASLVGPGGDTLPVDVSPPFTRGVVGAVHATVRFTPEQPGRYLLRLVFEPSLGVRQPFIDGVDDGASHRSVRVPLPRADCRPLYALADDAVACGTGDVWLAFADGGSTSFRGEDLVVAGRTLWSLDPAGVLERRVFENGALTRTHALPGFASSLEPTLHDEATALRTTRDGGLAHVQLGADGGITVRALGAVPPGGVVFVGREDQLAWWGDDPASVTEWCRQCLVAFGLRGLDPALAWTAPAFSPDGLLSGYRWRQSTAPPAAFTLSQEAESFTRPTGPFERAPLWLAADAGLGRQVLVEADDAGLRFTAWPRREVLHVGAAHVVLSEPGVAAVRVFTK